MSALGTAGPAISLLSVGALFVADGLPRPSVVGYAPLCAARQRVLLEGLVCCRPHHGCFDCGPKGSQWLFMVHFQMVLGRYLSDFMTFV